MGIESRGSRKRWGREVEIETERASARARAS